MNFRSLEFNGISVRCGLFTELFHPDALLPSVLITVVNRKQVTWLTPLEKSQPLNR